MGTPRLNLSQFTKAKPTTDGPGLRDYAAMVVRGLGGFAPGGVPGAVVGGVAEGLAQTIEPKPYDPKMIFLEAGLGAVPFGKAGKLISSIGKGAALSTGSTLARQQLEKGLHVPTEDEALQLGVSGLLGSAGGAIGHVLDLSKFVKNTGSAQERILTEVPKEVPNIPVKLDTTPVGPLSTPITKPVAKEGVPVEPNQPHIKLDMRTRPKNPLILSSDREAGRKIMNQILEESARAKAAKVITEEPKVLQQTPSDSMFSKGKSSRTSTIIGVLNTAKAFAASGDLSAALRQGIFLIGRKAWWNSWKPMIEAIREGKYNEINKAIAEHPRFEEATNNGLALTTLESLSQREEQFGSQIAEKIPLVGNYLIKPSERAYITFLNKLRMDLYNDLANKAERLGRPFDPKIVSEYINTATGRGSMGLTVGGSSKTLESAAPLLNTVFFSPRFIASRIQLLNPVSYVKMDPFTRKEAVRDLATLAGVASTALWLAKANGAEVEVDPTSTDFGKIKKGDLRVDILGGFGQYIRFFSQIAKGLTTEEPGPNPARFIESKLSPSARLALEIARKKDYFGRDITPSQATLNAFAPMITKDIYDLWKEDPNLVPLAGLSMFGLPVQNYGEAGRPRKNPTGIPRIRLNLPKLAR